MSMLSALMAYGASPFFAQAIVGDVANNLTAAGSTQGTALKLSANTSIVTTTAASTGVQVPPLLAGEQTAAIPLRGYVKIGWYACSR